MGSPPHARGKVCPGRSSCSPAGITPACAGKSPARRRIAPPRWDHPRMRGEKMAYCSAFDAILGSPPHARGKVGIEDDKIDEIGITPACAGKSTPPSRRSAPRWDHPRMRGEKRCWTPWTAGRGGSPPHARGKDPIGPIPFLRRRITPACAGKSLYVENAALSLEDHPRMRGEKLLSVVG